MNTLHAAVNEAIANRRFKAPLEVTKAWYELQAALAVHQASAFAPTQPAVMPVDIEAVRARVAQRHIEQISHIRGAE